VVGGVLGRVEKREEAEDGGAGGTRGGEGVGEESRGRMGAAREKR